MRSPAGATRLDGKRASGARKLAAIYRGIGVRFVSPSRSADRRSARGRGRVDSAHHWAGAILAWRGRPRSRRLVKGGLYRCRSENRGRDLSAMTGISKGPIRATSTPPTFDRSRGISKRRGSAIRSGERRIRDRPLNHETTIFRAGSAVYSSLGRRAGGGSTVQAVSAPGTTSGKRGGERIGRVATCAASADRPLYRGACTATRIAKRTALEPRSGVRWRPARVSARAAGQHRHFPG